MFDKDVRLLGGKRQRGKVHAVDKQMRGCLMSSVRRVCGRNLVNSGASEAELKHHEPSVEIIFKQKERVYFKESQCLNSIVVIDCYMNLI